MRQGAGTKVAEGMDLTGAELEEGCYGGSRCWSCFRRPQVTSPASGASKQGRGNCC